MTTSIDVAYPMPLARNLPVPATSVDVPVSTNSEAVVGWSFIETTGTTPAQLQLIDGQGVGGDIYAEIALSPGQSIRDTTGAYALAMDRGIFVHVISGSIRGSVWSCLS